MIADGGGVAKVGGERYLALPWCSPASPVMPTVPRQSWPGYGRERQNRQGGTSSEPRSTSPLTVQPAGRFMRRVPREVSGWNTVLAAVVIAGERREIDHESTWSNRHGWHRCRNGRRAPAMMAGRVAPAVARTTPNPPRAIPVASTSPQCATGSDRVWRIAKPGAIGGLLGAGLGAAGGAIASGGSGAGKGALIGGLVGAATGAGYGAYNTHKECGTIFGNRGFTDA